MLMIDLRREAEWKKTREVAEKIAKFVPFSTDFERFLWLRRLPPKRIETILESIGRIGKYRGLADSSEFGQHLYITIQKVAEGDGSG